MIEVATLRAKHTEGSCQSCGRESALLVQCVAPSMGWNTRLCVLCAIRVRDGITRELQNTKGRFG